MIMTKADLQKLIRHEVTNVVKVELQRMVKPLVQEAVAGALAGLLAEGIVKGAPQKTPKILTPDVPISVQPRGAGPRQTAPGRTLDSGTRRRMAAQMGYGSMDRIGTEMGGNFQTGDVLNGILEQTASEMNGHSGPMVESILDDPDALETISPESVDIITRDYSQIMNAMNRRGKLNG